jgi:hypothetical protein
MDDRLVGIAQIQNNADAPVTNRNTRNDFRYGLGVAYSPWGRFPISVIEEWDSRNSPFNINVGYGWFHGREEYSFGSGATAKISDQLIDTDYHTFDFALVNRGFFLWYRHTFRDAFKSRNDVAALTGTTLGKLDPNLNWNGNGEAKVLAVNYAIPLPGKMYLLPFYQLIEVKVDNNAIRRFGTPFFIVRRHNVGLHWYLAGENLAIKTHFSANDQPGQADTFQVTFQHQWRFTIR